MNTSCRVWAALLSLIAGSQAWAHLPHDNVYGVAVPADLSADTPWLVSMYNGMIRSEDGGRTFLPVGGGVAGRCAGRGGLAACRRCGHRGGSRPVVDRG